jgi:phosphoglycerate dehydrogenase-like enzyme
MAPRSGTALLYAEATPWEQAYVPTRLRLIETMVTATPVTAAANLPARASQADVVSLAERSRVDRPLLDRLPRLRLLLVRSGAAVGLDLAACRERGVAVHIVGGDGEYVAAEHTFALLLALSRRLDLTWRDRDAGPPREPGPEPGWELRGKTLGIVGLGRVGRRVAHLAVAFELSVVACDIEPDVRQAEAAGLHLAAPVDLLHWPLPLSRQDLAATVQVIPLDDLLARSDIVSLHLPLTDRTRHLIDAAAVARMKPGAVLVDTAHSALVDMPAVRAALQTGSLRGAAFDGLEPDERRALLGPPDGGDAAASSAAEGARLKVVVGSHTAGTSEETIRRSATVVVELVGRYMEGHPLEDGALADGYAAAPEMRRAMA